MYNKASGGRGTHLTRDHPVQYITNLFGEERSERIELGPCRLFVENEAAVHARVADLNSTSINKRRESERVLIASRALIAS